ncbi:MAG: Threonylcarbamoyladenosine tRNA methylthiotransferase MtaB [Chlamydiae bacterium]|nr:Threonylcarbamoyladenosine tRNA methylthiotransferase MtaB [Chlamydiota bacterium]
MSKKTYKVKALGCRTNQYEAQGFVDQLTEQGYREAMPGEKVDVLIVNTCTVTKGADSDSRHQIRKLAKQHNSQVIVTGCSAQKEPKIYQEMPEVKAVVDNENKEKLLNHLYPEDKWPEFSIKHFKAHTRAFVKVQDGCNSFCTYCIIPYVRGRSKSRPVEKIVKEITTLVQNGYKEVVLTGINVGDFKDGKKTLADLVKACDQIDGLERIRISSIDPDDIDDNLLDTVINGKKTCPSMHIVLQSGSDTILKKMNRKYTKQLFFNTIQSLQKHNNFTFTTDVIVGFPGETAYDFDETLEVIKRVPFAKVHGFIYSKRERTRAATYPNQVAPNIAKERLQVLLKTAQKQAFKLRENHVGKTQKVLMEKDNFGHTENFLEVWLNKRHKPNTIVEVTLEKNTPEGLYGTVG